MKLYFSFILPLFLWKSLVGMETEKESLLASLTSQTTVFGISEEFPNQELPSDLKITMPDNTKIIKDCEILIDNKINRFKNALCTRIEEIESEIRKFTKNSELKKKNKEKKNKALNEIKVKINTIREQANNALDTGLIYYFITSGLFATTYLLSKSNWLLKYKFSKEVIYSFGGITLLSGLKTAYSMYSHLRTINIWNKLEKEKLQLKYT
jgi:hypothetical protein